MITKKVIHKSHLTLAVLSFLLVFSGISCSDPQSYESLKKKAPVILEVELYKSKGKANWQVVVPTRVLKNKTDHKFEEPIEVYHDAWQMPVPKGKSIVFLEKYGDKADGLWSLLGIKQ